MRAIWYYATERFSPEDGDFWHKYIKWSKLHQLREVITLDLAICPCPIKELVDEDWKHNVTEDYYCFYFTNCEYLRNRLTVFANANLLAVSLNPDSLIASAYCGEGFQFVGFDLVEHNTGMSALTNCGGFPQAFDNSELSQYGLITSYQRAMAVKANLMHYYPDEPHAICDLWAIWRFQNDA